MKLELSEINNIIFDLGGVILDIDIKSAFNKFVEMGIGPDQKGFGQFQNNNLFKEYEIGALSSEEFRNEIRKGSSDFKTSDFDQVWNSIIKLSKGKHSNPRKPKTKVSNLFNE